MSAVQNLISELREKRLWPVAAVLIAALVAVPLFLSSSSKPAPVVQTPDVSGPASVPAIPAVSVTTTPSTARLTGRERDPFTQQVKPKAASSGSSSSAAPSTSSGSGSSSSSAGGTTASNPNNVAPPFNSVNPKLGSTTTTTTTSTKPKPKTYSYAAIDVVYDTVGDVPVTHENLIRLAALPAADHPLAVYEGIENDNTAVFLLSRIVVPVRGRGKCLPSRANCVFMTLQSGQAELFKVPRSTGPDEFTLTLTAIKTLTTTSAAKAEQALARESKTGRRIVAAAARTSATLRSFSYSVKTGTLSRVHLSHRTIERLMRSLGTQAALGPVLAPAGIVPRLDPAS